jgi:hypothetical protein
MNEQANGGWSDVMTVFERHQYAHGHEGISSDGEVAWLACTCGWSEDFEMPEDDIRLAERRWERHWAEQISALHAGCLPRDGRDADGFDYSVGDLRPRHPDQFRHRGGTR